MSKKVVNIHQKKLGILATRINQLWKENEEELKYMISLFKEAKQLGIKGKDPKAFLEMKENIETALLITGRSEKEIRILLN